MNLQSWFSKKSGKKKEAAKKKSKGSNNAKAKVKDSGKRTKNKRKSRTTTSKTKSSSNPVTPGKDQNDGTDKRHEKKEKGKNARADDWKETEQAAQNDEDGSRRGQSSVSKGSQLERAPRNVEITNRDIDESTMEKVFVKFTKEQKKHPSIYLPIDEKSKILMDRVVRRPYPAKYKSDVLLADETSSFYKPSKPKQEESAFFSEDTYLGLPKLAEVRNLPDENVFTNGDVPFWAVNPEPDENDMKGVDEPISVGSDYLKAYHDRQLPPLKTIKAFKLVLNEFQTFAELKKRDEMHFNAALVFSNTIRSLINVVEPITKEKKSQVLEDSSGRKPRFGTAPPETFLYSRLNPIQTARDCRVGSSTTSTTTTTTSLECG